MLWSLGGDSQLSDRARDAFLDSSNELYFSAASYWKICLTLSIGKLELAEGWKKTIDRELARSERMTILTSDSNIARYDVKTVW